MCENGKRWRGWEVVVVTEVDVVGAMRGSSVKWTIQRP